MSDDTLIGTIVALRVAVLVSWAMIGVIGSISICRVVMGCTQRGDVGWSSLALIGYGLIIFQWRVLGGHQPTVADPFVAIALFSFLLSAIGVFIARGLKAPPGHQRAAVVSHLALLVALLAAGFLSS